MKIKLSDTNSLNKLINQLIIIALAMILAATTWYILKTGSTVLVIEKDSASKKICDFN